MIFVLLKYSQIMIITFNTNIKLNKMQESLNLNLITNILNKLDHNNDIDDDNCIKKENASNIPKQIHSFYGSLKMQLNIHLIINYFDPDYADKLFEGLKRVTYNSDEASMIKIMGKHIKIPRKQVAFGDLNTNYHFSGTGVMAYDWNNEDSSTNSKVARELKLISKRVGKTACSTFNYALVNNYLNQTNSIGYHSDQEKELGRYPIIAGISLGQEREMYFKSNLTGEVIKISLPHGSMYIMYYPTNKYWKHSIPKSARRLGQRISLTFRSVDK
jgi:alkylated DNA repair dioxygenase AlkB